MVVHTHSHSGFKGILGDFFKTFILSSFSILSIYLSSSIYLSIYLVVVVSREKLLKSYETLFLVIEKLLKSHQTLDTKGDGL